MSSVLNSFNVVEYYDKDNNLLAKKPIIYSTKVKNEMLGMLNADFSEPEKLNIFNLLDDSVQLDNRELEVISEIGMVQSDLEDYDYVDKYDSYSIITNSKLTVIRLSKECMKIRLVNTNINPSLGNAYRISDNLWVFTNYGSVDSINGFENFGDRSIDDVSNELGYEVTLIDQLSSTNELPKIQLDYYEINLGPNETYGVPSADKVEKMVLLIAADELDQRYISTRLHENSDYPHSNLGVKILTAHDFYDLIKEKEVIVKDGVTIHNKSNTVLGTGLDKYEELEDYSNLISVNESYQLVINNVTL